MARIRRFVPFTDGKGFRATSYLLAAIGNPRLVVAAIRHVLNRKSRAVESAIRASTNPALRVSTPKVPQSFDVLIAGLSEHMAVLEIDRSADTLSLGVADIDLVSALIHLTTSTPGVALKIEESTISFGTPMVKDMIMNARCVRATLPGAGLQTVQLSLEGYSRQERGKWVSPNVENRVMRAVYGDLFETPGHTRAIDLLEAPTLVGRAGANPVDVVYTWVNHDDPDWRAMYREYGASDAAQVMSVDANSLSRFRNSDELLYSLRSLEMNAQWVNRIFIFSNCARPDWLRADDPRLKWIKHEEVIPGKFLPTFNSHVIESYLHKIPNLSERFIYCNDDFFIKNRMQKADFFSETGMSLSRLEGYGMVSGAVVAGDPDYLNAARNSASLLRERLGFAATQLHKHVPYALLRSVLEEIEAEFEARIDEFRCNRFRKSNDVNIPSFLYHHYAMATGRASCDKRPSILVKSNDIRWRDNLMRARSGQYDFVCLNEGGSIEPASSWHWQVNEFMRTAFPRKATWET